MERPTLREHNLSRLLHTILASCLTTGRARSVFRLVADANAWSAARAFKQIGHHRANGTCVRQWRA
eukprot:3946833-Heterocapsa_arctica.AAC.1